MYTWLKILLRRETSQERAQRAIRGAKKYSVYLAKRPFSDSSDDDLRTGIGGRGW